MKIIWIIIVFVCGALLPLQTGFNARLGKSIASPLYSTLICFIVGVLAMVLYLPFTKESIEYIGELHEFNPAKILGSCYNLLDTAIQENTTKIDKDFVVNQNHSHHIEERETFDNSHADTTGLEKKLEMIA